MLFYFSGCGNSRWLAESLAATLHEELLFIPDLQREGFSEYTFSEGESLGFVFPIYSWAEPPLVEEFVKQVRWNGKPAYTWFACTCGDEMGYARKRFSGVLSAAGLQLDACYCFQMPETYLGMPGFHLDTPEGAKSKQDAAKAKLPAVAKQIQDHQLVFDELRGSFSFLKTYLIRPGFVHNMSDRKYRVTEACNGCGTCAKHCPLHNIRMKQEEGLAHPTPHWQGRCTQCMACYHYCPQNAVQIGNCTKGKGQYHYA